MLSRKQAENWIKSGNFKFYRNAGIAHYVEYEDKEHRTELRIQGERNQFSYSREITELVVVVFNENKNQFDAIYNGATKAKLSADCKIDYTTLCNRAIFTFPIEKKQELVTLFRIIGKHLPIKTIHKEILESLDLKPIPNEKEFYDNLETLIKNNKVEAAIQQALVVEEDEQVLWNLIDLLEKNEKFVEALEVCQLIPEENINYRQANEKAEQIILCYELSNPSLSEEEQNYYLESKIRFMLRSNNTENQGVVDQHFNKFCGDSSLNPIHKNVKADEDTVIGLGKTINSLNKEILVLQKQNQDLLMQLKKLTSDNEKISPTEKKRQMKAASTIQFWYRTTRDKNNETSKIEHEQKSLLTKPSCN